MPQHRSVRAVNAPFFFMRKPVVFFLATAPELTASGLCFAEAEAAASCLTCALTALRSRFASCFAFSSSSPAAEVRRGKESIGGARRTALVEVALVLALAQVVLPGHHSASAQDTLRTGLVTSEVGSYGTRLLLTMDADRPALLLRSYVTTYRPSSTV